MLKRIVFSIAAAAFVFGASAALTPNTANAFFWTKDKAGKVWTKKAHMADKKAHWRAKMALKAEKKAGKLARWHAHWAAKKAAKGK